MTGQRRPRGSMFVPEPDPLNDAVFVDTLGVAGELTDTLEALTGYDTSTIKGVLFRKPPGGLGKFEWVEEVAPPIDMSNIMASLKARIGGGDYRLQIFAGGKTRKNIEFSIMGDRAPAPPAHDPLGGSNMFAIMMNMNAEARRDMMEQQRFAMEQQDRRDRQAAEIAARRESQLLATAGIVVPILAPLLFGGREKLADLLAIMQANKPEGGGLKETVETMAALKTVFGDGDKSAGFDADDLMGSVARLAGPALAAAGRAFSGGRGGGAGPAEEPAAPVGDGRLYLPEPDAPAAPAPITATLPPTTGNPVLDLIRPHVLYFYAGQFDPGLAAEAIADIMDRKGVTEEDLNGLVAAFALSSDWKADLAAQGIDLRGDPQWADDFLNDLVTAWADAHGDGQRGTGRGGSPADAEDDADAGPARVAVNGHQEPGATTRQ